MGIPQIQTSPLAPPSPPPPHLYPQALQLKLYQAFIFSIPILFSIILFLLFYLFYLKKRASSLSSPQILLPTSIQPAPNDASSACQIGLKKEVKDNLPIVLFDEELKKRDSQCCVCLGEFELKEELLQIPSCKHVFHIECIHHWLHSNSTCPLCRTSVIPTTKLHSPADQPPQIGGPLPLPLPQNSTVRPHQVDGPLPLPLPLPLSLPLPQNIVSSSSEQQDQVSAGSRDHQVVIPIEG